jgi:hypothetical protein
MVTNERIHICWDIIFDCNFRCPYCFCAGKWHELRKDNNRISGKQWIRAWNYFYDIYGSADVTISGGEPFIYKDFILLVTKLSQHFHIGICTNLSCDVNKIVDNFNPGKVELHPSFHPPLSCSEKKLFIYTDFYIKKMIYLIKNGYKRGVSCVAYPPRLAYLQTLKRRFNEADIHFSIQPYWGTYEGKDYPVSYTEKEKNIIRSLSKQPNLLIFQLERKNTKGLLCRAGQIYFRIHPDGMMCRCAHVPFKFNGKISNFVNPTYKLNNKPLACTQEFCNCIDEFKNIIEKKK